MDIKRKAFESWATDKFPIAGLGQFEKHNNGTYLQRSIRNMYEAWQAAKAQAVLEIQQSQQAEIDDLKAQLKAAHDSRIEFVEYCRKVESGDFVLVPTEPTDEMLKVANNILIAAYELRISNNQCLKRIYQAMIEAQESTND